MDMTPKSPEPESETPTRIQPAKPISFSNGIIKRHHHPIVVTYKECLKNHAAAIGGHALDGCGEFMSSPSSTPSDPTSLKCAACGCHRNFHRRDPEDSSLSSAVLPPSLHLSSTITAAIEYQPHHRHHPPPPPPPLPRSPNSSSPPPISSSYMLLALSGNNKSAGNSLPYSDLNFAANNLSTHHHTPGSRKRFRTKFSTNQKMKMHEFADRIGWKIQKRDENEVHDFCREIGVDKGVLKVWMHNNKNTFNSRRNDHQFPDSARIDNVGENLSSGENNNNKNNNNNNNNNAEDIGVRSGIGLEHNRNRSGDGRFESNSGGADGGNANASSCSS